MKAVLRLISIICFLASFFTQLATAQNSTGVFTSRYDNQRTGQDRSESVLTPKNVNQSQFGKVFSFAVDGQIYAQPLYVYGLKIPGLGTHNVVFVETQMDSVYAFDASGNPSTPLWQASFIDLANGIGPVKCNLPGVGGCGVWPYFGITSTPVIDPSTNTMYLVARTFDSTKNLGYQTLHALDITSGAEKFGGPVEISGSVPGNGLGSYGGMITFNPLSDIQRAGLLLLNGIVYIGWAGAEHGWIMGYNAATLTQTAIFSTTPNAQLGGVWQSGNGIAADSEGNLYVAVGDGLFDADSGGTDYGDSLLKLDANLNVEDYFTPMDQACRQQNDMDLGSSGPLILPTQTGAHPAEVLQSGKGGNPCDSSGLTSIYLADQTNLGKFSATQDNVIEEIYGSPSGYWSSAAYASSHGHQAVYYAGTSRTGTGNNLEMFLLTNGQLGTTPYAQSANRFQVGATPTVSSHGDNNAIVWAIERQDFFFEQPGLHPAILYGYDAHTMNTLYSSNQNSQRDQPGCGNKFQVPTVANGQVYVATQNELDIFGLLPAQPPAIVVSLSVPCFGFNPQTVGSPSGSQTEVVTNTGTASLGISAITVSGINASDFSESDNCVNQPVAPGGKCSISIVFTPGGTGPRIAELVIQDNAGNSPQNAELAGVGQ